MTNQMQVFNSNEFGKLEIIEIDGKPYFPATRCAEILGYEKPHNAITRHCRYSLKQGVPHPQSPERTVEMNFIPEGDLYRLIVSSKLPAAQRFEKWVFDEVLPVLRKTGAYITPEAAEQILRDPDFLISVLQEIKAVRQQNTKLEITVGVQDQQIAEMRPKAGYYDVVLACKDAVAITTIAKDYGKSGQWMNERLHALGVQFKQSDIWLLYQKHAENGYTCTKTHPYVDTKGVQHSKIHTYWTQKGRLFIYALLKNQGIYPLIERNSGAASDFAEGLS